MKNHIKQGFLEMIIGQRKNISELEVKEAYSIVNLRLNMINVEDSYINSDIDTKCEFGESEHTTEHLFECPMLQRLTE